MAKAFPKTLDVTLTKQIAAESIIFELTKKKPTGCKSVGHCVLAHAAALALGDARGLKSGFQQGVGHNHVGFEVCAPSDSSTVVARYIARDGSAEELQERVTSAFDDGMYGVVMGEVGSTFRYDLEE